MLVAAAILAAAVTMPAQQMVTETRDPAQPQDADFAKSVEGVDDGSRTSAVRWSIICRW